MSNVVLPTRIALSDKLSAVELGLYIRGKALLATGKRGFSVADLGESDELVGAAIDRLVELKLIVHKGKGYYALAKGNISLMDVSSPGLVDMLAKTVKQTKAPVRMDGRYEQLSTLLISQSNLKYGYEPPRNAYTINVVNRGSYRKIVTIVDEIESTLEEFVSFVFEHDWTWTKSAVPYPPVFSNDQFLSSFEWYVNNKELLLSVDSLLDDYDNMFGIKLVRDLEIRQLALSLQTKLDERGVTFDEFLGYVRGLNWTSMGGSPPFRFLVSKLVDQFVASKQISTVKQVTETYLDRVFSILQKIPIPISGMNLEDHNWFVAEALLEPLSTVVSTNGSPTDLVVLVRKAINEKNLPAFGSYFITYSGKLTPLSVYIITYAAQHLPLPISPAEFSSWKDFVKHNSSTYVDCSILEEMI